MVADHGAETCGCAPGADSRIVKAFDERAIAWTDAAELPEMVDVSARLLDLLRDSTLRRPTVLELGCGTGGVAVALLGMGASRVTGIDLSPTSIRVANRRAAEAGYSEQVTFETGNAAYVDVDRHDWLVLDRVICCVADVGRLVTRAVDLATERVVISVPESRGWRGVINRPTWAVEAIWDRIRGGCRGYVHDVRRIERTLADAGFAPKAAIHAGLWHIAVYDRQ